MRGIAVIAGALLVAVVVPSAELLWNWTQARHRMVIDELRELRSAITLTAPPPDRVALPLKERLVIARRQGRDIRHGLVSASHGEADEWRTKLERWTKQVEYVLAREAPTHLERFSSDFELPVDRIPWSPITGLRAAADHRIAILDQMLVELEPEYPGGAIN